MNDQWTNRLSEYIDGELDATERGELEAHLATCGQCYATLGELRQVLARAKTLEDSPPVKELWSGIAAEIRREQIPAGRDRFARRRLSFTIPQLLAASIALAVLGGGSVMIARHSPTVTPAPGTGPGGGNPTVENVGTWRVQTDVAIAELEEALARNERQLDTSTVRIVRQNLAVIDQAIAQAQHALKSDPGSSYLNLHLANTMRRKIDLLRRANALAAGRS